MLPLQGFGSGVLGSISIDCVKPAGESDVAFFEDSVSCSHTFLQTVCISLIMLHPRTLNYSEKSRNV